MDPDLPYSVQQLPANKARGKSYVEVVLDSPCIHQKGSGFEVQPAYLSGYVVLHLTSATSIKEVTLRFRGRARLPALTINSDSSHVSYVVCHHDWSFLEGEKDRSHTLQAGRHSFPFVLRIGDSLPSSISTSIAGGASVAYTLHACVMRSRLNSNMKADITVPVVRSPPDDSLEYQQSHEVDGTWGGKLIYSIMLPHRAWAAGEKLTALVKLTPLDKEIRVVGLKTTLYATTRISTSLGPLHFADAIATWRHDGSMYSCNATAPSLTTGTPDRNPHASSSAPRNPYVNITPSTSLTSSYVESMENILTIALPSSLTPSHALEPIMVEYRMHWTIYVLSPDGYISEARCSLPLHLLDRRFLDEARSHTYITRQLFFRGAGLVHLEEDDMRLPSYESHVHDSVPEVYAPHAGEHSREDGDNSSSSSITDAGSSGLHTQGRTYGLKRHDSTDKRNWSSMLERVSSAFSPNKSSGSSTASLRSSSQRRRRERKVSVTDDGSRDLINAESAFVHRGYNQVPDYWTALRGFIGGIPPLSSTQDLPSYLDLERSRQLHDPSRISIPYHT